jgi:hypothetical protein
MRLRLCSKNPAMSGHFASLRTRGSTDSRVVFPVSGR